ncbi:hypothetical protein GCM10020256_06180 [Streptomyces thermocoprophilus]
MCVKGETLVLGERKTLTTRPNGRSADRIAPRRVQGLRDGLRLLLRTAPQGTGRPRHGRNIDAIIAHAGRHIARQGHCTTCAG